MGGAGRWLPKKTRARRADRLALRPLRPLRRDTPAGSLPPDKAAAPAPRPEVGREEDEEGTWAENGQLKLSEKRFGLLTTTARWLLRDEAADLIEEGAPSVDLLLLESSPLPLSPDPVLLFPSPTLCLRLRLA